MTSTLEAARQAYGRRDWVRAYDAYQSASRDGALPVDDLAAFADAAWWLGRTDETLALSEQAYRLHLDGRRVDQAARQAMDIAFLNFLRGDTEIGSGWIARARRLVRDAADCVERGYLLSVEVDEALAAGDYDSARAHAREVQAIADLFRDQTLAAVGLVGEGIALIKQGQVLAGLRMFDEAMLPVLSGDVEPTFAGNIYCQIMGICHELADLPRARRWTEATERWCAGFPSAVMFAGICRVHRAQLLQVQGRWFDAEREAVTACQDLVAMNVGVVAEGHYQVGEIRRLRGDLAGAEEAYRQAHQMGRDPQPGLALLRLDQGRVETAVASIRTALAVSGPDRLARVRLLAAQIEIGIAAGETGTAVAASDELADIAATFRSGGLVARARHARGAVLLAQGHTAEALGVLRDAHQTWRDLDAPYEAARVRVMLAQAYTAMGDREAAEREWDAAAAVFAGLGATADLRTIDRQRKGTERPGGLTRREAEVLALVSAGRSNRDIVTALFISEKTVARHLANIYTKIGVGSRTEAAAYAFSNGLGSRPT